MKKEYVLGLLFSEDLDKVVLIRKLKPEWQNNKLNGVGGKIEEYDESPLAAMHREFMEEAGVEGIDWQEFCLMEGTESLVYCFKAIGDVTKVRSMEKEKIEVHSITPLLHDIYYHMVPNLKWLIPMAMSEEDINAHLVFKA